MEHFYTKNDRTFITIVCENSISNRVCSRKEESWEIWTIVEFRGNIHGNRSSSPPRELFETIGNSTISKEDIVIANCDLVVCV